MQLRSLGEVEIVVHVALGTGLAVMELSCRFSGLLRQFRLGQGASNHCRLASSCSELLPGSVLRALDPAGVSLPH